MVDNKIAPLLEAFDALEQFLVLRDKTSEPFEVFLKDYLGYSHSMAKSVERRGLKRDPITDRLFISNCHSSMSRYLMECLLPNIIEDEINSFLRPIGEEIDKLNKEFPPKPEFQNKNKVKKPMKVWVDK